MGVDLTPPTLPEFPANAFFFQGDIFDARTETTLAGYGPFDTILSDAAPLTTGNRTVDTGRSFNLCERVIALAATPLLKHQGNLVIKIFQGGDEKILVDRMKTSLCPGQVPASASRPEREFRNVLDWDGKTSLLTAMTE